MLVINRRRTLDQSGTTLSAEGDLDLAGGVQLRRDIRLEAQEGSLSITVDLSRLGRVDLEGLRPLARSWAQLPRDYAGLTLAVVDPSDTFRDAARLHRREGVFRLPDHD